ncbi:uncharacterized protein C2orf42-like isoform X1 [Limulus polyphemus]|uniref:Uncharacterized protein C2orf42-like isoform X1 n=1 Tax=Limulus polyphemus TaxID=6850 RepID=A0ABM1TAK0_LIMPO|nr:uncharacterized protein C2orf42-like isoform X1 [Limulus polyphemus]XP_022252906.1 uncharacterized protein C2orf42-like isoform X1 [Limulus polyphemus]
MSSSNQRMKTLFGDLGKPTLRGIRKCPKCGTYNGTRRLTCKNKTCDVVYRDSGEHKKSSRPDAVRIITGSTDQLYSVRVRDRGPDYRRFVQLPLIDAIGNSDILKQGPAHCYVETCVKSAQQQELNLNPCHHIKAAVNCLTEGQPLTLKNSVLNALPISTEIKQSIWLLATETAGPLVQRVSKNTMVVKCKTSTKQPLGFLHFSFFGMSRTRDAQDRRFQCSCKTFKQEGQKRCVHFYACICAFASDEKLSEEFSHYITLDNTSSPERHLVAILSDPEYQQSCEVKVEVLPETASLIAATEVSPVIEEVRTLKKRKKDDSLVQASNALLTLQDSVTAVNKSKTSAKRLIGSQSTKKTGSVPIDESTISISFEQWLASVTERINETMHYQFDGHPDHLVFHAPETFLDCLQQRIAIGGKKKRLPNSTTAFIRKDALPMGTFLKYTWHITNIIHLKQIFDTPKMPLEITRSFVENRDGTYDLYKQPSTEVEELAENFCKTQNTPLIKPFELKTFLKVGKNVFSL